MLFGCCLNGFAMVSVAPIIIIIIIIIICTNYSVQRLFNKLIQIVIY